MANLALDELTDALNRGWDKPRLARRDDAAKGARRRQDQGRPEADIKAAIERDGKQ